MKAFLLIIMLCGFELFSQSANQANSKEFQELQLVEMFQKVSDATYFRRQNPWHAHYYAGEKEFWEKIKTDYKVLSKAKFEKLHRKVDQQAFLYLLENKKTAEDFSKTPGENLPLPLLIQKVFYYSYTSLDDIDKCAESLVRNLDDSLVKELCADVSLYRHIYLNGAQIPEKIGKASHKNSAEILQKITNWIVTEEDFFYHEAKTLNSIIFGAECLRQKEALDIYNILITALKKRSEKKDSLKEEIEHYLTLLDACVKAKKDGADNALADLMKKGHETSYLLCLTKGMRDAIPIFLEKFPYRSWKEIDDFLRMGKAVLPGLEKSIEIDDWRKLYFEFLKSAAVNPKLYAEFKNKARREGDYDFMKAVKKYAVLK